MKPVPLRRAPGSRHSALTLLVVCAAGVILPFIGIWSMTTRVPLTRPAHAPAPPYVPITTADLYSSADHDRLMRIGTALQKRQPITDADLDWAIALLQHGPVTDIPLIRLSFALRTMSQLINHQSMTPAQTHKLAQAILPYADDPPPAERAPVVEGIPSSQISLQDTALIVLGSLDDNAATAKLEDLAQTSPTLKIRQTAGGMLSRRRRRTNTSSGGN